MGNKTSKENQDSQVALFEETIQYHLSRGNIDTANSLIEQAEIIKENRKMTYPEMRELIG